MENFIKELAIMFVVTQTPLTTEMLASSTRLHGGMFFHTNILIQALS